nr:4801_t:CDS:2 [Entrophospora candida]
MDIIREAQIIQSFDQESSYDDIDSDDSNLTTTPRTIISSMQSMQLPSINDIINNNPLGFSGAYSMTTLGFLYRGLFLSTRKQRRKFILFCLKDIEIWHPIYESLDLLPSL